MNIDERIALFHGMIRCNYEVYLWQYDEHFELLYTNRSTDLLPGDMVTTLNFKELLTEEAKQTGHYPPDPDQ